LTPEELVAEAADGYRLAKLTVPTDGRYAGPSAEHRMIVPRFSLDKLKFRGMGSIVEGGGEAVSIAIDETGTYVRLTFESGATITSCLIAGNFPDCNQIIPNRSDGAMTVPADDYIQALGFVRPFALEAANITRHEIDGNGSLKVSAVSADIGTVTREIEAKVTGEMPTFALNVDYASSLAKAASWAGYRQQAETVTVEGTTGNSPFVFRADGWLGVCMPMHVRE